MSTKNSPKSPRVNSAAAAAARLGVLAGLVKAARKMGCPAFDDHGRIDVDELRAWLVVNREAVANSAETELESAQLAKTLEEVRKLKIANDFKEGLSITLAEYDADIGRLCAEVSGALNGMPQRLAPDLAGLSIVDAEKILSAWCDEVLTKLSK